MISVKIWIHRPQCFPGSFIPELGVEFGEEWQRVKCSLETWSLAYSGDGYASPVNV